jgi:hypothetical protein
MKNTIIALLSILLVILLIIGIKVALAILKIFLLGAIAGIVVFAILNGIYNKKE